MKEKLNCVPVTKKCIISRKNWEEITEIFRLKKRNLKFSRFFCFEIFFIVKNRNTTLTKGLSILIISLNDARRARNDRFVAVVSLCDITCAFI